MTNAAMLHRSRPWRAGLLAVVLILVAGCAEIRLISDYDQYTDEQTGVLQRKVEELFTGLERGAQLPDCKHSNHQGFYTEATIELNLLLVRNEIRPKNGITLRQLQTLKDSLSTLEELHQLADQEDRCLGAEELVALRTGFGTSFSAILKLELAKKRGEDGSS